MVGGGSKKERRISGGIRSQKWEKNYEQKGLGMFSKTTEKQPE